MFKQTDLDKICTELESRRYYVGDNIFGEELCENLRSKAVEYSPNFKEAGVGRAGKHQLKSGTRSDRTQWLTGENTVENNYLLQMEQLRETLNRYFFLGLKRYDSHFSIYEKGAFYARHVDAFSGKSNRIMTTILYLNHDWKEEHGGELVMYKDDEEIERLAPIFGRLVVFLSDTFPHEVLLANRERFAISGWYQ